MFIATCVKVNNGGKRFKRTQDKIIKQKQNDSSKQSTN